MVRHLRSTGRPAVCAPVVNRDVNQLELGRRPSSSPTLDLGRRSRVEEREVNPESGDYGPNKAKYKQAKFIPCDLSQLYAQVSFESSCKFEQK